MRKLLIVIDMQNDFIDGALGTKEAETIVEAVKAKIRSYPAADVIATMDTHGENYMETQEGKYLPVPHCIKGTKGWEIRPDIVELLTGADKLQRVTYSPDLRDAAPVFVQKAVDRREQHERVRLDKLRYQRRKPVVVAERKALDLLVRDDVVLVYDGDDARFQQMV